MEKLTICLVESSEEKAKTVKRISREVFKETKLGSRVIKSGKKKKIYRLKHKNQLWEEANELLESYEDELQIV